jgi:hypothetical protein
MTLDEDCGDCDGGGWVSCYCCGTDDNCPDCKGTDIANCPGCEGAGSFEIEYKEAEE